MSRSRPAVFGEPANPSPIRFRSNVGTRIKIHFRQGGNPFDFTGWTGRCSITDAKGNPYSPAQNPVVDLDNTDPNDSVVYLNITRAIADFFKGKVGMNYDIVIDNGASSWCICWGGVTVDIGNSPIP